MTLVEMMVATAVASLLGIALLSFGLFSTRSFVALGNYADLSEENRRVVDRLTKEIRHAKRVISYGTSPIPPYQTNSIVLESGSGAQVTWNYKPIARQLVRQEGAWPEEILLTECDYLAFTLLQRNPKDDFDVFEMTTPNTAKVLQVQWRCSRQLMGTAMNTENVQTARIVIRKQGSI
jgi:hypothetical protein